MATKVAVLPRKDPFAVVGEAMVAAADAMKKSTSDARHAASQAVPAVRSALAKSVYIAAYYGSFGVVFATLAVTRWVPSENAFGFGVRDGAAAAHDIRRDGGARSTKTTAGPRVAARKRTKARRVRTGTAPRSSAPVVDDESQA